MKKVIITGANGAGKSHFAARLSSVRPEVPVVAVDALKLRTGWQQKSRPDIDRALADAIAGDAWILEGGPSFLPRAIQKADSLIWLDPPGYVRAWRLALRPWKFYGKTRPELPEGNIDWPLQQYKFAYQSLRKGARFRSEIAEIYQSASGIKTWRCCNARDRDKVVAHWVNFSEASD